MRFRSDHHVRRVLFHRSQGTGRRRLIVTRKWLQEAVSNSDTPQVVILLWLTAVGIATVFWPITLLAWQLKGRPAPPVYFGRADESQGLPTGQGKKI